MFSKFDIFPNYRKVFIVIKIFDLRLVLTPQQPTTPKNRYHLQEFDIDFLKPIKQSLMSDFSPIFASSAKTEL